jgi:hypothetical protein
MYAIACRHHAFSQGLVTDEDYDAIRRRFEPSVTPEDLERDRQLADAEATMELVEREKNNLIQMALRNEIPMNVLNPRYHVMEQHLVRLGAECGDHCGRALVAR